MQFKMKANASNNYTLSKEGIESIRGIIARGIAIDKEEDKLYGDKCGDELPSELNTQEKIWRTRRNVRSYHTILR